MCIPVVTNEGEYGNPNISFEGVSHPKGEAFFPL
jgi:hypothetical protein